jgi:feruloyl esterase
MTHVITLLVAVATAPVIFANTCENLSTLALPNTTITSAETVAAGAFTLASASATQQAAFKSLPAFCRVAAELKPTADSDIKIEVWMPSERWNGKFLGIGNGGWSGAIVYPGLATGLNRGYATASTNTGHDGGDAAFALGHPEKLANFGYRAVHEMNDKGKGISKPSIPGSERPTGVMLIRRQAGPQETGKFPGLRWNRGWRARQLLTHL